MLNFTPHDEHPATGVERQRKDVRVECPFLYKTPYTLPPRSPRAHAGIPFLSFAPRPRMTVSFFLHRHSPFSSLFPTPLSRSSFIVPLWYYLPPFNWDLPSRSSPPFLWPTRYSASQSGRGVATSRERVCFPRAGPTWWRLWENSHAADYATRRRRRRRWRRCSTGGDRHGNKLEQFLAFTLQKSLGRLREERIIRTKKILRRQSTRRCSLQFIIIFSHATVRKIVPIKVFCDSQIITVKEDIEQVHSIRSNSKF